MQQTTVPEWALKAQFLASYHITHANKLHTIGEDLIVPATKDIVNELLGEDMAQDLSTQLLEQVRASEYFTLQLDENTDVSDAAPTACVHQIYFPGKV